MLVGFGAIDVPSEDYCVPFEIACEFYTAWKIALSSLC